MSCIQTIQDYGLRSIGLGERLLRSAQLLDLRANLLVSHA